MPDIGDIPDVIETPSGRILSTLNWLRAGVLGSNDGIISTAAIIFGVAGASAQHSTLILTGVAAIAAGALSMAAGEYVSVSTQRDLERAELERQKFDLASNPERELRVLARLFEQRGVTPDVAMEVSRQMSAKDALSVHARAELGIDPEAVTNPWAAAVASLLAFTLGGLVPLVPVVIARPDLAIWISGIAVMIALGLTGGIAARLGRMAAGPSIARNVLGGIIAIGITYGVGMIAGTQL
ncbi:VIT1/CCC1 transporter family protein [Sphingomonas sp.]|uniref:VIT1/CCC1 transporter family protein n=1 Tax=Sphingomonas sp. TaxID=28214 RepID=UPI0038A5A866